MREGAGVLTKGGLSLCSVTLSKHFLCPAVKTYLPGTYIYVCIDYCGESRETYICMCVACAFVCTRVWGVRLSARAAAATIIRWGFRIASGGLASIVVTSIRPMKIPGYTGCPRPTALSQSLSWDHLGQFTIDYPLTFNGCYYIIHIIYIITFNIIMLKFSLFFLDISLDFSLDIYYSL